MEKHCRLSCSLGKQNIKNHPCPEHIKSCSLSASKCAMLVAALDKGVFERLLNGH
jgi:hypothetical protein